MNTTALNPATADPRRAARRKLKRRLRFALGLFALGSAMALLLFAQQSFDGLGSGDQSDWLRDLLKELTGAYAAILLVPGIIWLGRRFPFAGPQWAADVLPHLTGAVIFGVLHTSLTLGARAALFPLFDVPAYEIGPLLTRYLKGLPIQFIAYVLTLAVTLVFDRYRAARDRQLEAVELRSRLTEAQLEMLQRQLEPQFLLHTLNAISELVFSNPRGAEEMLGRLASLLRHAFAGHTEHETSLADELRLLDLYLDIMRLRFCERLFVQVDAPAAIRAARVPRFLLQPLVANALRQSDAPSHSLVSVKVSARDEQGDLVIRVRDQGPGVRTDEDALQDVGLANAAERITRLYGPPYGLRRESARDGEGAEVTVRLPLALGPRR